MPRRLQLTGHLLLWVLGEFLNFVCAPNTPFSASKTLLYVYAKIVVSKVTVFVEC